MKAEKVSEKKKKNIGVTTIILRSLMVLAFLGFVGVRGLSLLPGWGNIVDTYGYYSTAIIEQDRMITRLSSGVSYAYAQSLTNVLWIVGHAKWVVAVYHILLQILTLFFILAGSYLLFGKVAAYLSGMIMALSPWLFNSIFLVSPENFYLLFWSIIFWLIGLYFRKGRKSGWCRNNTGEGFLLLLGFLVGVLCIWHYFSFILVFLLVYAMIRNAPYVRERLKIQQNIQEMEMLAGEEDTSDQDKDDVMPNSSQLIILLAGMLLGGYCTLMKYTGVTGNYISAQFNWWLSQFTLPTADGRFQDMSLWLPIQMTMILIIGIISVAVLASKESSEADESAEQETYVMQEESKVQQLQTVEEKQTDEEAQNDTQEILDFDLSEDDWKFDIDTVDDDWRFDDHKAEPEVKLLDNPLPLPKKHEKKAMDFETTSEKEDFDFAFDDIEDDFDV